MKKLLYLCLAIFLISQLSACTFAPAQGAAETGSSLSNATPPQKDIGDGSPGTFQLGEAFADPNAFLNTVLSKVMISNGHVIEIHFKNGMTHKFVYK